MDLSEEIELIDEFSEMFFRGENVDASAYVVDEGGPRDNGERGQYTSPVRQGGQSRFQYAECLR